MFLSGCPTGEEVIPECEVLYENDTDNLTSRFKFCKKHPEHEHFIPVSKFSVRDLPPQCRNLKTMDEVFRRCALTVRIKVSYTSLDRPNTFADSEAPYPFSQYKGNRHAVRYGTGSVVQAFYNYKSLDLKSCPCHLCKMSGQPKQKFWWVRVRTATHVIHDRSEAESAEFDCFFDTDDRKGVKTIYGFDTFNALVKSGKKYRNDVCDILCVTHDWSVVQALSVINPQHNFLDPAALSLGQAPSRVIVSHPHGCSKKLTIGNILHLTVPISEECPVGCEIPFKKGTIYRQSRKRTTQNSCDLNEEENNSLDKNENASNGDTTELQGYNLKKKLDSIISFCDEANVGLMETHEIPAHNIDVDYPREKYLVDFYNSFLREHCLKILLLCTLLHQRNKQQKRGKTLKQSKLIKATFEEMFIYFLGKQLNTCESDIGEGDGSKTTDSSPKSESNSISTYWQKLWEECDVEYSKFKSMNSEQMEMKKTDCPPPIVVSWFDEVEEIMNSVVLAREAEGELISEEILPAVVENGLKAGIKILMMHEELRKRVGGEIGEMDEENAAVDKGEKDEDFETEEDEKQELEKVSETYSTVGDAATYTLPPNAPHCFQVLGDHPEWIVFPPGTVMKTSDGNQKEIGYPFYQFQFPSMTPELCYVSYDINTCPGSSGANVHCSLLGKYLGTYFPHSGYVKHSGNRSGIRDNFYTLFSKMLLFDPSYVLGGGDGKLGKGVPSLIEGSKLIMLNLKEILSK